MINIYRIFDWHFKNVPLITWAIWVANLPRTWSFASTKCQSGFTNLGDDILNHNDDITKSKMFGGKYKMGLQ